MNDQQQDELVREAVAFASRQPASCEDWIGRHFWPEIAAAVQGVNVEALRRRVAGLAGRAAPTGAEAAVFNWLTSRQLAEIVKPPHWAIKRLLVTRQPGVIGGGKKMLKTTVAIDAAISMATATRFLDYFDVPAAVRVAFISGESGDWCTHETARRVAASKGLVFEDVDVLWSFRLPQLGNVADLAALQDSIVKHEIEVLFIDPLYLCLLSGIETQDVSAANLYQIGPLLLAVARACLDVGCTPLLIHHSRMHKAKPLDPPELEDLAFAGIQEFAAQWVLLGRRKAFVPGEPHRLWLSGGGRCGQGGLWALNVNEGRLADDFTGRVWCVNVMNASEANECEHAQHEDAKEDRRQETARRERDRLLQAVDTLTKDGRPVVYTAARATAHLNSDGMKRAVLALVEAGTLEETTVESRSGTNNKSVRVVNALRRPPKEGSDVLPLAGQSTTVGTVGTDGTKGVSPDAGPDGGD